MMTIETIGALLWTPVVHWFVRSLRSLRMVMIELELEKWFYTESMRVI
jgi:hypothetical protein